MHVDAAAPKRPTTVRAGASRDLLVGFAALLPFVIVALWRLADGPGIEADDYGQYLMHAQALAEGRPYTDIGYIYSRFRYGLGPQAAPPGLPLTLTAVYMVFGPNITVMRIVMLFFATAFVLLAGLYFAKHDDRRLGIGVALLCGLSPDLTHGASQLLTDLPFAALVWAIIYLVDQPGRLNTSRLFAITMLGAFAIAYRVPGVALVPAFILFTALRYREHGLRPAIPLLVWVLGLVFLALMTPIERMGVIRFGRVLEADWTERLSANFGAYWWVVFESHLHPFPWPRANDVFHVATGALMAVGIVAWIRGAFARFGTIFAFVYGGMLLVMPFNQERYLWPLFPFFVFGVLNGVRVIAPRLAPPLRQQASAAALGFALILVLPAMIKAIMAPRRADLMKVPEVQELVDEIRAAAATAPVRVVFYKPRSFAWATGIPAMGAIGGPAECLISEIARGQISHVIQGSLPQPFGGERQRDIESLVSSRPDLFVERLRTKSFVVYRVNDIPAGEALEARSTCERLRNSLRRRRDRVALVTGRSVPDFSPAQFAQGFHHFRDRASSAGQG